MKRNGPRRTGSGCRGDSAHDAAEPPAFLLALLSPRCRWRRSRRRRTPHGRPFAGDGPFVRRRADGAPRRPSGRAPDPRPRSDPRAAGHPRPPAGRARGRRRAARRRRCAPLTSSCGRCSRPIPPIRLPSARRRSRSIARATAMRAAWERFETDFTAILTETQRAAYRVAAGDPPRSRTVRRSRRSPRAPSGRAVRDDSSQGGRRRGTDPQA